MIKVNFYKSTKQNKKLMAIFSDINTGEIINITHFGAKGYSDYTQHKDNNRKERYIKRHIKNENWDDFFSAGSLSRYILWNKPTLEESITDFKRRFNLF